MGDIRWPAADREWAARYRRQMATGKDVPRSVLDAREHELLAAAHGAGRPAQELFGDPVTLAAEDAETLATTEEAVLTSPGGALRPMLIDVGGTLLAIGGVGAVLLAVRSGLRVDIQVGAALLAAGLLIAFLGLVTGRAAYTGGRAGATVGVLVAAGAIAVACIATAVSVGPEPLLARDVSTPLLGLGALVPGIVVLVGATRMSRRDLRADWPDAEWLRRFRGGLRGGLVPAATARAHIDEIEQTLASSGSSASGEFGHPLVLAREVARADRTARARRWWLSTIAGTGTPMAIAALVLTRGSWGALTVPLAGVLLISALVSLTGGWTSRPWRSR